jgi:hypothetical protein
MSSSAVVVQLLTYCCVVLLCRPPLMADESEQFFEREIRPLLSEKCVGCHGAKQQSGGLRLDSREAILRGGDSGPAAVSGDVAASLLVQAIRYDGDLQMPPEQPLGMPQREALMQWIRLGLPWPAQTGMLQSAGPDAAAAHWAFQPVVDPPIPPADAAQARNPVDAFLLQGLSRQGLRMSPEADRRTLIRRASFTITGLPPTAAEVEAFVRDPDPQAYEQLIERLLHSAEYGQHWARHWLDIARYSDTKGYVYGREERFWVHAWNYRDWVVSALNADLPYDRFLLLQIAADQVPDRADGDLAAMGFLTLGRRFLGVRRDIIDDQIDVVCRGTMALTVGCARCHDHKYDPIPTADYYSLYGVFDSSREFLAELPAGAGAFEGGAAEFQRAYAEKVAAADRLRQERRATTAARVRERVEDYLRAQLDLGRYPEAGFDQIIAATDLLPSFVHRWRDYLRLAEQRGDPLFVVWHAYRGLPPQQYAERSAAVLRELRESGRLANGRLSAAFTEPPGSFDDVITGYSRLFRAVDAQWQSVLQQAEQAGMAVPQALSDADSESLRQVLYGSGQPCFVPDEPICSTEYDFDSGVCNELWKAQVELDRLILNAPSQPRFAVVLRDRVQPVEPRIFVRGNPAQQGADVPRQFLGLLSGAERQPFRNGSGRLELAERIIERSNPLTARVMVNRVWAWHFGRGLASSLGDFGLRAERPAHPELLDWLTTRFVESGWSLRSLHRLILLSAAWRQSSGELPEEQQQRAMTVDPGNVLLWRMNLHRLSFEELRDSLLAVAGSLDRSGSGRPQDLFQAPYPQRRTLYGLVDRQFFPGTLRMFDFANPDLHIPQRSETTVPQQALFLMNHPLVLEQVRRLADRVSAAGVAEQQVRQLFLEVLQREPDAAELSGALAMLSEEVPEQPEHRLTAAEWSYGYGAVDEATGQVAGFQPLPHFTGTAWQGGAAHPDGKLGWVQLTAQGGHPGNDRQHAAVRRWTAPRKLRLTVKQELVHEPEVGDGIRTFVISSKQGLLLTQKVHHQRLSGELQSVVVEAGETLDFVVDIGTQLNSDQYLWRVELHEEAADESAVVWHSELDFPVPPNPSLTPLEQLVQVLFCANEFLFVD